MRLSCRRYRTGCLLQIILCPPISSPKDQLNYLFQIIRNLAIDHYRKQALINKHIVTVEEYENLNTNEISPEAICEDKQALEKLSAALSELPERTRYAFERHRIDGVPQKEIAKELGVSPTLINFMIKDALIHCSKFL
ncbi:hypothetical protein Nstercoris_00380 [Nitrosomonas stercoris]|uniref:RNA polymerase sigma factor 70 region 4 type 2 domain-containing protein n=1 Tax=Nitrosomonas stercoris TaxID=1444684 RepID=A0A4Y1YM99_9PROT|nr:hypothetical protein Nstercoris_00380 [Nitrosomonas stercoris]